MALPDLDKGSDVLEYCKSDRIFRNDVISTARGLYASICSGS